MTTGSVAVVSWSGGKDSSLALRRARQRGLDVVGLFTMFDPGSGTSRSHGLPPALVRDQARCLDLPLHVGHAGWDDYEAEFKHGLGALVQDGVETAVFGDIFLDGHREWAERVCAEVGCRAMEPLWGEDSRELAGEALSLGIEARVCVVRLDALGATWLGRAYDRAFVEHLEEAGVDACGEHGEFHTVALSGPDFRGRLRVEDAEVRSAAEHAHWHVREWRREGKNSID